ncbi:DEKNAAC103412 [Brettanomyces naardenensis]|uniref:DEKNAAC103412 n=1 Tax=Brettanomyces naardenensis TaxID=13370 RepID=A0A448YNQ2_BRENA|nr:DEKNAAC103412 [Brettanomyces naardenensis]
MATYSSKSGKFHPLSHVGPICALQSLKTLDDVVLAGEGPVLKAYNVRSGQLIAEKRVFPRNKIHGIKVYENTEPKLVAIFGGRSLSVISFDDIKLPGNPVRKEYGVEDWIFAVEFSCDGSKLYILTAHNVVITVDVSGMTLIDTRNCGWKSILYSGCIRSLKDGRVLICCGTVMDGILVWDLNESKLIYNLKGHEGSIFDVELSESGEYLVSCSDDRSIKVWDLAKGSLLATGWGHGARIWGLDFFDFGDQDEPSFKVLSSSEDCTARVWKYIKGSSELVQEKLLVCHTGRSIWSQCVNDKLKLGFTGGADGKLKIHDLNEESRSGYKNSSWSISKIAGQTNTIFAKGEAIKGYYDFAQGLVTLSSEGKFFVWKDGFTKWEYLFEDKRFTSYSIVTGFEGKRIVVVRNKEGNILMVKFDEQCRQVNSNEIQITDCSKVGNMLTSSTDDRLFILTESLNPTDPLVLQEVDEQTLEVKRTDLLPKPQGEKVSISAVLYDRDTDYLVVGSRFATILLYDLQGEPTLSAYYKNLVKGDTVSGLALASAKKETREIFFYLTMKDCRYYIINIDEDRKMQIVEDNQLQRGFLEGLLFDGNGDFLLYGFKSDVFYIWNETRQFEVARIICGGPHRQWSFHHSIEDGILRYRFIFTRASDLQLIQNGTRDFKEFINSGLHGREVRSMCVMNGKDEAKLLVSGGEDTTVKLSELKSDGSIELLWTQRQHGSGLQSVHPVNDEFVMSSSAREELFLWKVSQEPRSCLCLYRTIKPSSSHPDLRVMDFDTIEIKEQGKAVGFVVATVYSDSHIRIWYFNYEEKSFKMLINGQYKTCCILLTRFLVLRGKLYLMIASTNGHLSVFDVNSDLSRYFKLDGNSLTVLSDKFEVSELDNLIVDQQIHQSSIKALDLRYILDSEIVVVTGGDDNALILTRLIDDGSTISITPISFAPDAAASTITCVNILDQDKVFVASVDQKVRTWDISRYDLKLIDDQYTTVADTGCATVADFGEKGKMVVIGGAGASTCKL